MNRHLPLLKPNYLIAFMAFALLPGCYEPPPGDGGGRRITSLVTDWRDEVIYQVLIDRFADGDYSNNYNMDRENLGRYQGGDYQGILDNISYFKDLGVTTLWISPAVKNVEEDAGFAGYHGYWTQDFKGVNPHFGDLAKLQEMVDKLHDEGFKVILDIVTNHVGQLFFYDINKNGQPNEIHFGGAGPSDGSKNADLAGLLSRASEWDPDYDTRGVQSFTSLGESGPAPIRWLYMPHINRVPVMPSALKNEAYFHKKGRVTVWEYFKTGKTADVSKRCTTPIPDNNVDLCDYVREQELYGDFPGGLKDLATENEAVRKLLIEVFQWWITVGDFDGFRIDTLKHVEYGFWEKFCPAMRAHAKALGKQKFLMFGEAFSGVDRLLGTYTGKYDKDLMGGVQYLNQVDSVFYFSQKYRIDYVFKGGGGTDNLENLHKDRLKFYRTTPHTDGVGVAPTEVLINFLDNHDVSRFLNGTGGKKEFDDRLRSLHTALTYLFTTVGIPNIYYGTEQQFFGGNDPGNREVMWKGNELLGLKPYDTTNATYQHIKALNQLRTKYSSLRRGDFTVRWASSRRATTDSDAGLFAYERVYQNERSLVVVNATSCDTGPATSSTTYQGTKMVTGFAGGSTLQNMYADKDTNDTFTVGSGGEVEVKVPCQGWKILLKK